MPAVKPFITLAYNTKPSEPEGTAKMMEKIFSWPVLVSFCAIFIVTWIALQTVSNMRLESEAQMLGSNIFSWNWPGENCQSRSEITEASIVKKTDNDAIVKISGKQTLTVHPPGDSLDNSPGRSETVDCSAVLTLYRQSNHWVLGRVEF